MAQGSAQRRAPVQGPLSPPVATGSALVHWMARLTQSEPPETGAGLADRLGQWLGWTDAIALSSVLAGDAGAAPGAPVRSADAGAQAGQAGQAEAARVRSALAAAIDDPRAWAGVPAPAASADPSSLDFLPYRRHLQARQQAMETAVTALRDRLRRALAGAAHPSAARLAALDAVLERALAPRERALLAQLPALLERHFERLRRADPPEPGWLERFREDLRSVLQAELDVRLQPVEGLLKALRHPSPESP